MPVSDAERQAMARLLEIMNGNTNVTAEKPATNTAHTDVVLAGPGQVTSREIQAMANVLEKFNQAVNATHKELVQESFNNPQIAEALITEKQTDAVRVGSYKIEIRLDEHRVAGKQYYDVMHTQTGEILAHELSLYEAAHGLVKLLNSGKYVNHPQVRELLEAEATYTSHRIDAIRYHQMVRKAEQMNDWSKQDVYEARKAASMDRAAQAKVKIKRIYSKI